MEQIKSMLMEVTAGNQRMMSLLFFGAYITVLFGLALSIGDVPDPAPTSDTYPGP